MSDKLSIKEELFCQAYVSNLGNGTKAVEKAYPNIKSTNSQGSHAARLLRKDRVIQRIKELREVMMGDGMRELEAQMRELGESIKSETAIPELTGMLKYCQQECLKAIKEGKDLPSITKSINALIRTQGELLGAIGGGVKVGIGINNYQVRDGSCEGCPNNQIKVIFDKNLQDMLADLPPIDIEQDLPDLPAIEPLPPIG